VSYPIDTLLQKMAGKTVTLGWDVVVAYNTTAVNTLFAQQYVQNVAAGQDLPPQTTTLPIAGSSVTLDVVNLTLGPPLISFPDADTTTQQAMVTMDFIAGELVVLDQAGEVEYVSSYQSIVPGDQYALTMTVDLGSVTGEVEEHKVVVDLSNASNFKANLIGAGSASLLGSYFQTLFQDATKATLTYELGSLVFGTGVNLVPQMFEIRTQPPPSGGDDGAVLLFVATSYNPDGGNLPGLSFPYLIPDGYSGALVVASATLFGNIMVPYYEQVTPGNATLAVSTLGGSNPASYIRFTGGSAQTTAPISKTWFSGGGIFHSVWSGSASNNRQNLSNVVVPYAGLTIQPANDLLSMSWSSQFNQSFGASTSAPRVGTSYSTDTLTLTISANLSAKGSVDSGNVVSFAGGGSASVNFASSGWLSQWFGNGNLVNVAGNEIASAAQPVVEATLKVTIPEVDAFAVSHLLFPSSNALQLSAATIPGDLALFGAVTSAAGTLSVSPLQAVIAWGQTQQFTASQPVTKWTRYPAIGGISPAGLYTAPKAGFTGPVVITAYSGGELTTAVVTIVSAPVMVSPAFSVVQPGAQAFKISSSVLGGASPAWSIAPANGSLGTVDQSGNYTPPSSSFPSGINIAVVTATADGQSASMVLCLFDAVFAYNVTPTYTPAPLTAGQTQQFTSEPSIGTWSLSPPLGTISSSGLYTAPAAISAPATVVVIVQDPGTSWVGFALVMLAPTEGA